MTLRIWDRTGRRDISSPTIAGVGLYVDGHYVIRVDAPGDGTIYLRSVSKTITVQYTDLDGREHSG